MGAGALEPGEADDFARVGGQVEGLEDALDADAVEDQRAGGARRLFERGGAAVALGPAGGLAEHLLHRPLDRHPLARLAGDDDLAAAQDRDPVGDGEDVLEEVGDVDDADAAVAEVADDLQQALGLGFLQGRGRLVEDQDVGLVEQRAGDLDQLLLAEAQRGERAVEVDVEADRLEHRLGLAAHRPAVERDPGGERLAAEEEVLEDVEVGEERQLLGDDRDPLIGRLAGVAEGDPLAVELERPLIRGGAADDDLDQRRLAGAVGAEQGVHLTRVDLEIDAIEGLDTAIALGEFLDGVHRRHLDGVGGGVSQPAISRLLRSGLPSASRSRTVLRRRRRRSWPDLWPVLRLRQRLLW